jgi:SAM-dependent methyltransferase
MRAREPWNADAGVQHGDSPRPDVPAPDIRTRVYERYVHSRDRSLAPARLEDLRARAPYIERLIRAHFPSDRNARILDLGCGHGALVYFARRAGYGCTAGVDGSPEQVAEARRLGIEGVQLGDVMDALTALPDDSLDVVVAFDLIEHFSKDELLPLVDEVRRVLKPGGRWIIHTPNAESPFFGRIRYGDITHEQAFTTTSLSQLLLASGIRTVAFFEDTPVVHGVRSAVRYAVWKVARALLRLYLAAETGSSGSGVLTQNLLAVAVK